MDMLIAQGWARDCRVVVAKSRQMTNAFSALRSLFINHRYSTDLVIVTPVLSRPQTTTFSACNYVFLTQELGFTISLSCATFEESSWYRSLTTGVVSLICSINNGHVANV